jgi:two-component system, NarL family, sensor histidine kinase UhpB
VTLRLKINLIVGVLMVVFTAVVLGLQLRSMRDAVHEEVVAANRVAAQFLNRTALREASSTAAMLPFLRGMGRVRSNDFTLLDAGGAELYRSPMSPYKAGRNAPQWFQALISPPPSVQTIALADGRLIVQANATRAEVDAWDYAVNLAAAALALLLVVNVLVFWLVGRAVRPFGAIVDALDQLQAGRFDISLPPLRGSEAAAIGAAFNRMVRQLREHIEVERRAVRAELQLSDSRELTRWIDRHVEEERHLIARELHDELGQAVTAIRSMALSIAQKQGGDPQVAQAARLIADESSRLYDAMHGIIPRLTPLVLDSFGLAEALDDLGEHTRLNHPSVATETHVELGSATLSPDVALTLYRAAQEGITNALQHGSARHVQLSVEADVSAVTLSLRDDGVGLPAEGWQRPGHYGLRWLTERIESVRGELRIEPASPRGVHLWVRVPLAEQPA